MTPELIFSFANMMAIAGWLLLAAAPRWPATGIIAGRVIPLALSVVYTLAIAFNWAGREGGFSTLADVAALFRNPWLLLGGWVHYLAFDLLVGSWELKDAQARKVPHVFVVPCLVLTFLFGPAGWLLYGVIAGWHASGARAQAAPVRAA